MLFKIAVNQIKLFELESVVKTLLTEKFKANEIYRIIFDVYEA